MKIYDSKNGFTIIEILFYVSITSVIVGSLTLLLLNNLAAYYKSQASHNVLTNINGALRTISDEIKYSKSVYLPTSTFATDFGQLSLETTLNPPPGEQITYVDYYLDNGRIYEKREGTSSSPLTSERVIVNSLVFTLLNSTISKSSVTVQISARTNTTTTSSPTGKYASTTLTSSITLRGAY